eukprot:m.153680 g.153680  ORF g.153680 m.153680 type:complete len:272 (-) comp30842_c0_seq1:102-917(-)
MSQQDFEDLQSLLKQLAAVKEKLATDTKNIRDTHKKLSSETTVPSDYMTRKLKGLYKSVLDTSAAESDLVAALSLTLTSVTASKKTSSSQVGPVRQSSVINSLDASLPLWPDDGNPIPLCGAIPASSDWIITPGHQVAALVSEENNEQRWILGTVINASAAGKYVVEDIMEESSTAQRPAKERHALDKKHVLALPQWSCSPGIPGTFYGQGLEILALYPQTTCFYPAVVQKPPNFDNPNNYMMHFYDDDYEDGRTRFQEVPARFVVQHNVI